MEPAATELAPVDRERRLDEAFATFTTPHRSPLTSREEALLGRGVALELAGGLAATAWGEGPTVLLVHGWNSRGTHWGSTIDSLNQAGLRAVALDAPGHGASPGASCHVVGLARELIEVAREVGPLAGVVAHSFGAGATVLALGWGLPADRVALLAGPASLTGVVERWARSYGLAADEIPAFLDRVERGVGEPVAELDLIRIVGGLEQAALIVHDRSDEEVPVTDGLAIASAWPGARVLITTRYGHRRILIAREVIQAVVAFLGDPSP